ncbi:hypothetical protein [Yinghuangia soli]|uniref:Uncharacterized protein n=1 Tax=Yinghuangia soli TaxID=2908204 RepID=A0AA41Q2C2_9ACTN|nr:hypothetical protein [Yinghuangia soli]MCF2530253.1 hypothetical protein [Yinghuangia soli]
MKGLRYTSYVVGGVSAAATAFYLVVYLWRWQWNRALICGVLLIVIEVFLLGVVLLGRIARLERHLTEHDLRGEEVRRRLEQAREDSADRFRWLDKGQLADPGRDLADPGRHYVFIPVLLAAGVVLSAISWAVQRAARLTVLPSADRRLAGRLAMLAAPTAGARAVGPQLEDDPAVPGPHRVRTTALTAVALAAVVGVAAIVDLLGDATQTRPEPPPKSAATTLVFRVDTRTNGDAAQHEAAARDIWEDCRRGATAVRLDETGLSTLSENVFAVVVRPALTPNDLTRLRGCLLDANADGVQASILGEGQAAAPPWLP